MLKSLRLKEKQFTILKVSHKTIVISSMDSPSNLPNRPPSLSVNSIQKMKNIAKLKKLEDFRERGSPVKKFRKKIIKYSLDYIKQRHPLYP